MDPSVYVRSIQCTHQSTNKHMPLLRRLIGCGSPALGSHRNSRNNWNLTPIILIEAGTAKKGDVLGIARIAGIMAAKKTNDLLPLCRPLALTRVAIEFEAASARRPDSTVIFCATTIETVGPTGVEMEALTAVQVALLTIHDMCKAVDRGMSIHDVRVVEKHGGEVGEFCGGVKR